MAYVHFAGVTDTAQCQHVQARSRSDLTGYFGYTVKRGESHGYNLEDIRSGYADWAGASKSAAKEASMLLKNFNVITDSAELSPEAEIIAEVYEDGRTSTVQELFKQHFRCYPTLAYTLDVLWNTNEPLDHEEVYSRVMQYGTTESTIRDNSIRNGLNLLTDFDAVKQGDSGWSLLQTDQPTVELTAYGIYILGHNEEVLGSQMLREQLPRLLLCDPAETEKVLRKIRTKTTPFELRTTGDSSRTTPYGGIYEIDLRNVSATELQAEYF